MRAFWNRSSSNTDAHGPVDTRGTARSEGYSNKVSDRFRRIFYNHRKYFIVGYLVLFISVFPVADQWAAICFITTIASIFLFTRGFALRNVLILHRETYSTNPLIRDVDAVDQLSGTGSDGFPGAPKEAVIVGGAGDDGISDTETENKEITNDEMKNANNIRVTDAIELEEEEEENDEVWEVEDTDFLRNELPADGITIGSNVTPDVMGRDGIEYSILGLRLERYMILFVLGNLLFFGAFFGNRIWEMNPGALFLLSLILLIGSLVDRHRNGIHLYPAYLDMIRRGILFDPAVNRIVPASYWYERYLKKDRETVLKRDVLMLSNWKPHSYVLTDKGIYLEKRKGLMATNRFMYVPLLSLKGMKLSNDIANKSMLISFGVTVMWAFLIGVSDPFFMPLMFIAMIELLFAFHRAGTQIKARALNLTFALSREKDKSTIMEKRLMEIDGAHRRRMKDTDADKELESYSWMEDYPPCPGLKEVKKSVRGASMGIILPTFFYSMMKLIQLLDQDTSGFELIVWLFILFAVWRIMTALSNVWNYQKYLERPEKGSMNLVIMNLSIPELIIILGYLILSVGIFMAIMEDMLTIAFLPGIIGGLLIIVGRYSFNSTFRGIDYEDRASYTPEAELGTATRFAARNNRMIVPLVSFIILLFIMISVEPYFGETLAEVSDDHLEPRSGNNWRHLPEEDEDILGLMGLFGLTVRVYEDDAEDGNGYPAVLSVVSFKFPVTPDEEDMLDEMREQLQEFSDDERVELDEPPIDGEAVTVQGHRYLYFIYNGTAENGTSRFSKGEELRIISAAFKVDEQKSFVIAVGIAKVSEGRLVIPSIIPINPTDTTDTTNWDEMTDDLIPNIIVS